MWMRIIPGFVVGLLFFAVGTGLLIWRAGKGKARGELCRFGVKLGAIVLFLFAIFNSMVFGIATLICGGSPHGGKVEAGRYYVMNHGEYTEVSKAVWHYLSIHEVVTWIAWPVAMVGLGTALVIRWWEGGNVVTSVQGLLGDGGGETVNTETFNEEE